MIDKKKRNFLRRFSSPFKSFIFPPYYEKKEDFLNCVNCETKDCVNACKEKIIKIENEMPIIDLSINGCTFCDECASACTYGVLKIKNKKNKLNAEFIITPNTCIAWNNTICFSCYDICEENAIIYKGMFNPVIDLDKCSGCGFCLKICPVNAIKYTVI